MTLYFDWLHILAFAFAMEVRIYPFPAAFFEYWFVDRDIMIREPSPCA